MAMRIVLSAMLVAAGCSLAAAQSSTATSGTTKPLTAAPSATNAPTPNSRQKSQIPPAAQSGESGLRVGNGAVTGAPVEIKREK